MPIKMTRLWETNLIPNFQGCTGRLNRIVLALVLLADCTMTQEIRRTGGAVGYLIACGAGRGLEYTSVSSTPTRFTRPATRRSLSEVVSIETNCVSAALRPPYRSMNCRRRTRKRAKFVSWCVASEPIPGVAEQHGGNDRCQKDDPDIAGQGYPVHRINAFPADARATDAA